MGMVESDIKIAFDKRDIKTFAVVADNNFVFLDVLGEIIKVCGSRMIREPLTFVITARITRSDSKILPQNGLSKKRGPKSNRKRFNPILTSWTRPLGYGATAI